MRQTADCPEIFERIRTEKYFPKIISPNRSGEGPDY